MEEELASRRLVYVMRSYTTAICGMISGKVKAIRWRDGPGFFVFWIVSWGVACLLGSLQ